MDSFEVLELHSTSIGDAPHLLVVLLVGEGKGDLVVEVKHGSHGEVRDSFLEEAGDLLGKATIDLFLDVSPQLFDERLEWFLEQLSLC